ncbi:MAG TPA: hypothetical protein VE733_04545 [Streptosporangiaceae bacterium]|jgi:putative transposase|nr:hypothetical protein [Streptosporangiaceae bacterium]
MRFPRRKKKTRDALRCTYTTGALRVDGPRHIVLPGVGRVATAENLRPIWRHIRRGTGRLLSATIREAARRGEAREPPGKGGGMSANERSCRDGNVPW